MKLVDELLAVLVEINGKRAKPADPQLIKQIVALVVKSPLDEDRAKCQDQILEFVKQQRGGAADEN